MNFARAIKQKQSQNKNSFNNFNISITDILFITCEAEHN